MLPDSPPVRGSSPGESSAELGVTSIDTSGTPGFGPYSHVIRCCRHRTQVGRSCEHLHRAILHPTQHPGLGRRRDEAKDVSGDRAEYQSLT
jgi:hypothetical protein